MRWAVKEIEASIAGARHIFAAGGLANPGHGRQHGRWL